MLRVTILRALSDNYVFLLRGAAARECAVVDPGEAAPVVHYLEGEDLRLAAIVNTHHHGDHTGGNRELLKRSPGIPVYGGALDRGRIPGQTHFLAENDTVDVCGARARVLEVPGHTRAHVAYFFDSGDGGGDLFSGDTLFGGTIGNLFEGTPETMFESVRKIRALPRGTRIWCSHEYTLEFVREAAQVDPRNARLAERLKRLQAAAPAGGPTVPLALEEECATNPFLRWDDAALAAHLGRPPGIAVFLRLCEIT